MKIRTLKMLLNHNLRFNASKNNLKVWEDIYVQEANSIYLARVNNGDSNIDEKEKINNLCQHIRIGKFQNKDDIDDLLESFYKERNLDPMCNYIRLALSSAEDLWTTKQLLNINHNESWFRTDVYSFVWDKVFLNDDSYIS